MPAAHDIYNEELRALRMGDALYHPEPAVGEMPVEIGDVGYTKQGAFNRLFNASRPANDPLNAQWGVPEGFQRLDMGRVQTYDRELRPGPLHSETISHAAIDIGASGGIVLPADITFCFSCKSSRGAILMLETHMSRTTAQQEGRFKTYLEKHCIAWYQFAADNDILVEFGDIILVTECSNTIAWASAVYSHSARDFGLQFSVGGAFLPIQNGLGVSVGYERIGPVKHRRSHRCAITPADVNGLPNDQTVFIKGYRPGPRHLYPRSLACKIRNIMSRSTTTGDHQDRNFQDRQDRNDQGSSPSGSGSTGSVSPSMLSSAPHSSYNSSLENSDNSDFMTSLSLELPDFHPAVALLAHEIETSSAQVAIVHDDEWCLDVGNTSAARIIDEYAQIFFGETYLEEKTTIPQTSTLFPQCHWDDLDEPTQASALPHSEGRNKRKLQDWLLAQGMPAPSIASISGEGSCSGLTAIELPGPSAKRAKHELEGLPCDALNKQTEALENAKPEGEPVFLERVAQFIGMAAGGKCHESLTSVQQFDAASGMQVGGIWEQGMRGEQVLGAGGGTGLGQGPGMFIGSPGQGNAAVSSGNRPPPFMGQGVMPMQGGPSGGVGTGFMDGRGGQMMPQANVPTQPLARPTQQQMNPNGGNPNNPNTSNGNPNNPSPGSNSNNMGMNVNAMSMPPNPRGSMMQQVIGFANKSATEMRQQGVSEQIIAFVESNRGRLQRTAMERFRDRRRGRLGGMRVGGEQGMQGEGMSPRGGASPRQGQGSHGFVEFFNFSSFGTLDDDDTGSKAPTPELSSSSTNSSPELNTLMSGADHDLCSATELMEDNGAMDLLQLGTLKEIDGGESAYFQPSEWDWDGLWPVTEHPWTF